MELEFAEASYFLIDLKERMRQKKYKLVQSLAEKKMKEIQNRQRNSEYEYQLKLIQTQSVLKLLERNIRKKFKYSHYIIMPLLSLIHRNIESCYQILFNSVVKNDLATNFKSSQQPISNQLITNCRDELQESVRDNLKGFLKIVCKSYLVVAVNLAVYRETFEGQDYSEIVNMIQVCFDEKMRINFEIIELMMFQAKIYSFSDSAEDNQKSEEMIEDCIESIFDKMQQINKDLSKIKKQSHQELRKKYERQNRKCLRLMSMCLLISNRNKMKMKKQDSAAFGVIILKSLVKDLNPAFNNFKRMMAPELYLQEQFLKYKKQKKDLNEFCFIYFSEMVKTVEDENQKRLNINRTYQFYNKKMAQMTIKNTKIYSRSNHQERPSKNRSTDSDKTKTNFISLTQSRIKGGSCQISERNNFQQILFRQIDNINKKYTLKKSKTFRKDGNPSNLLSTSKKYFGLKENSEKNIQDKKKYVLKKKKFSPIQNLIVDESHNKDLFEKYKQDLIAKKSNIISRMPCQQFDLDVNEARQEIEDHKRELQYQSSIKKSKRVNEKDFKKNIDHIGAKNKEEMFVDLLIKNKQFLGIKKICEKVEALRKKEQQKSKIKSNRMTSQMHIQKGGGGGIKKEGNFQSIAKQIIKKYARQNRNSSSMDMLSKLAQKKSKSTDKKGSDKYLYRFAQESVDILKNKLANKEINSQKIFNKSSKQEEIFKLKLKKIGSSTFFLRKDSNEQSETFQKYEW